MIQGWVLLVLFSRPYPQSELQSIFNFVKFLIHKVRPKSGVRSDGGKNWREESRDLEAGPGVFCEFAAL